MESGIAETLRAIVAGQGEGERVRRIEHDGIVYWVKRPEAHSLLWRLRKGDPALLLTDVITNPAGTAFEYSTIVFRGDTVRLKFDYKRE